MPTTIKLKNSVTTTNAPSSLVQGEVAINITDKKVWVGNAATTPIQLLGDGGSASFTSIAFGAGTVSSPSITFTGDTNTGIYSPAADTIAFTEGGVESMRIDSAGNLTVGNTSNNDTRRLGFNSISGGTSAIESVTLGATNQALVFKTTFATELERMRITGDGQVGIGISSPTTPDGRVLHISNNNSARIHLTDSDFGETATDGFYLSQIGADSYLYNFENGFMMFATNNTERMRITSAGDVGIGTSSPEGRLQANASSAYAPAIVARSDTSAANWARIDWKNNNFAATGIIYLDQTANFSIRNDGAGPISFLTNGGNERMRITSAGDLGIGTSSPASKFDVTGIARFSSTAFVGPSSGKGVELWYQSDSDKGFIGAFDRSGSVFKPMQVFGSQLEFNTGGSERMRIDSNGDVLVGTTGTGLSNKIGIVNTGQTNYGIVIRNSNASTNDAIAFFNNSGTRVGLISYTTSATTYSTSSDYRLKENIAPMTGALARVSALKPVTYQWKVDGSAGEGFIAHELQEIVPDCVTGKKDDVDAEGNPVYQGIDTSFLVATLTAALQEAHGLIKDLQARVETLEAK